MIQVILKYRSVFIRIGAMLIASLLIIALTEKTEENAEDKKLKNSEITLWYNDNRFDNYYAKMAEKYKKDTGITVHVKYISDLNYLEKIAENSAKQDENCEIPDIYMLNSQNLEAAYSYGIAGIVDDDKLNSKNYPDTALDAVRYHGHYVAYPLAYDTAFMVYNTAYMQQAPASFDDIINYAFSYDSTANPEIHYILKWNVRDLLYNYEFIGGSLEFGGKSGDDASILNIKNDYVKQSCMYYQNIAKVFSEDNSKSDFSWIVDSFSKGETVCAIMKSADLIRLNQLNETNKIAFKVCKMPSLNKELTTRALSETNTLVVNFMSDKEKQAEEFAKYLSYKKSDQIYSYIGLMPARTTKYKDENLKVIEQQYQESAQLPKLITSEDYFVRLQSTLNKIWNGEDINSSLDGLCQTYIDRE